MEEPAPAPAPASNGDGLKVINASLFHMANKSMAKAYTILGYSTENGLLQDVMHSSWELLSQAAEAKWPSEPSATPRPPYTREDWDAIWGPYDVVTDLASPFALDLIKAYPGARVVVVQRDFDAWWPAFAPEVRGELFMQQQSSSPQSAVHSLIASTVTTTRPLHAMKRIILGFFGAETSEEVDEARAREAYDAYFAAVRSLVPPERRLEYTIGSGWEPLCAFLGKEIPNVEFPSEEGEAVTDLAEADPRESKSWLQGALQSAPWVVGIAAIGIAWFYSRRIALR
ncbi:uncharacterized protein GGS25DRAFT_476046 [Hypoxylon fragiforme]|uniref:uncharacterized protein n=1 Tax=Hypoxylon fragiforme TaxID=63214 RepID=UPI0020C6E0DF|nr:uncharacterized protein GGS25DRAFT_476046 [Hypoxylon fragiforme]KAI2612595.1 hypothetical protein GGS25DRAFT_476046 [Hypoxylon fragiforme]